MIANGKDSFSFLMPSADTLLQSRRRAIPSSPTAVSPFVNPLDATIEIPDPEWNEEPLSRFKEGVLRRLAKRRPLTTISLNWLDVEDDDLDEIADFTELEQLALDRSDDGIQQLATLYKLETLSLDNTQISDAGIAQFAGLTDLKRLFVRNTNVTKDGLARLREAIPGLRIYH